MLWIAAPLTRSMATRRYTSQPQLAILELAKPRPRGRRNPASEVQANAPLCCPVGGFADIVKLLPDSGANLNPSPSLRPRCTLLLITAAFNARWIS